MLRFGIATVLCSLAATLAGCGGPEEAEPAQDGSELATTAAASRITLHNWVSHPKIVEVRSVVEAVDAARMVVARRDNLCEGIGDSSREKRTDDAGKIRRLDLAGGSDDSASTQRFYYDAAGHLRFAFEEGGDVHGGAYERRVYFAVDGTRIWQVDRSARTPDLRGTPDLTKAPFSVPAPDMTLDVPAAVISNPAAAFDAPPVCD